MFVSGALGHSSVAGSVESSAKLQQPLLCCACHIAWHPMCGNDVLARIVHDSESPHADGADTDIDMRDALIRASVSTWGAQLNVDQHHGAGGEHTVGWHSFPGVPVLATLLDDLKSIGRPAVRSTSIHDTVLNIIVRTVLGSSCVGDVRGWASEHSAGCILTSVIVSEHTWHVSQWLTL